MTRMSDLSRYITNCGNRGGMPVSIQEDLMCCYNALFQASSLIILVDQNGFITSCSTGFIEWTGYPVDQILDTSFLYAVFFPEKSRTKLFGKFLNCLRGKNIKPINLTAKTKVGGEKFVYISLIPIRDRKESILGAMLFIIDMTKENRIEGILEREHQKLYKFLFERNTELEKLNHRFLSEITKRKQEEEKTRTALREVELFKSIIDRSHTVLFLWKFSEGWPLVFVSENIQQFGYSFQDFCGGGMTWEKLVYPEDYPEVSRSEHERWAEGVLDYKKTYRIVTKDGDLRWVSDRTLILKNEQGEFSYIQDILIDITEEKKMEEELMMYRTQLENMVEERTEELQTAYKELEVKNVSLQQKNIAITELVHKIEDEKKRIKDDIVFNINKILLPLLHPLRTDSSPNENKYLDMIECSIKEISSSFGTSLFSNNSTLTPRELEICQMIRHGFSSKEIGEKLCIATESVDWHRINIRKKLGLRRRVSLHSYLQNL